MDGLVQDDKYTSSVFESSTKSTCIYAAFYGMLNVKYLL